MADKRFLGGGTPIPSVEAHSERLQMPILLIAADLFDHL